ncbi:histone-lysine N-methyltransferase SETMAR [Trichonephila clavipes]|nr:histone-lysine N-methyltransferase SETMAR [Trichonephila clavipes]
MYVRTTKVPGNMEVVGAYRIFERSNVRNVQYNEYYGDGDSKGYESVKNFYGINTVTKLECIGHVQKRILDVKDAPRTGRPVAEIVDKITETIQIDLHVSSHSITQEQKIDHKTVLNHLRKVGLKKKLDGQTLNSDTYCQRLNCLKLAIDQKRPELANRRGIVFHQDNARPHTPVVTRQKLWELGWEVLMHPPYSPNLALSEYHLFLTFQNFLSDKKFGSREDCESRLQELFANKNQDFYERCFMKLPLKWQQIIPQNGAYFDTNRTIQNMLNRVLNFM